MNYTFHSHFSVRLEAFIAQKNALGYPYHESSRILRNFDLFCLEHYPQETKLTKEICLAWAVRKRTSVETPSGIVFFQFENLRAI